MTKTGILTEDISVLYSRVTDTYTTLTLICTYSCIQVLFTNAKRWRFNGFRFPSIWWLFHLKFVRHAMNVKLLCM